MRLPNAKSLVKMMKSDDDLFVDFIDQCLEWKPEKRTPGGDSSGNRAAAGATTGDAAR